MTEQERRALFFKATGMLYCHSPMWVYQAFCKGIEYEREECAKVCYDKAWEFKDQAMAASTKGKGQRLNDAAIAWYDAYEAIRARSK